MVSPMHDYVCPTSLTEALARRSIRSRVLAGGTDLYPGAAATLTGLILDLTAIPNLQGFTQNDHEQRIGACTTRSAIAAAPTFMKLGARAYLVISIAVVAACLIKDHGCVTSAFLCGFVQRGGTAIARGGGGFDQCSNRICRRIDLQQHVAKAIAPIDDIRATASYRAEAAAELPRRSVAKVLQ